MYLKKLTSNSYYTMKKIIFIMVAFFLPLVLFGQVKLTGVVKDAKTGEPMIGVTVKVKSTNTGSLTDVNGKFSVDVPANDAALVFSYIGYKSITLIPKTGKPISVEMDENLEMLDEVVVVGYGTQKKESMVGAISSIKSQSLVSSPVSNLTQALAGKATGVSVVQQSGEIGRDEASIFIRGKATFNDKNAQPLIVVDGIIRESFAQIDANEVESINILKDASATAVFGVKGANGVIIVTTKRGLTGKAQVSFSAQTAINSPMRLHTPIDAYRTALLKVEANDNGGNVSEYSASQLMNYRTKSSPFTEPDVDWMNEIVKPYSMQQQYNVNVRGGSKTVRYFISAGYFNQDSPLKQDNITSYRRYNFRSNLDIDVTRDLSFSLSMGTRIENRKYISSMFWSSWDIYHLAFAQSGRQYPMYNMNGSYSPTNLFASILDSGTATDDRTVLETSFNTQYKMDWMLKGLSLRGQVAYDDNSNHPKMYNQQAATYEYIYPTDTYIKKQDQKSIAYNWDDVHNSRKLYFETGLSYIRDFGVHSLTGLALYNGSLSGADNNQFRATLGYVGRMTYNYDKRYLAEVNLGINGSENFAPEKRWGVFPAFSLGWIVSNEKFWQNSPIYNVINNFKLRSSLGWVGNDRCWDNNGNELRFQYLQTYNTTGGYLFGDNTASGISQGDIANKTVTWEKARKLNIGFETALFNNLFILTGDYFFEYRWDILSPVASKPDYVGANFVYGNIGSTQNKGFEVELTHNYKVNKDFSYSVKGNFSFARNKILEKGTGDGTLLYQRDEGYSIDMFKKYVTLGYFQTYDEIEKSPSQLGLSGNNDVRPGDLKYKDINGDGVINEKDMVHVGFPSTPEIQYGITLGIKWKNFDATCLFQGSANASFDKNWDIMWAFSNNANVFPRHWYYWTPETGNARSKYTQLYGHYQNNEAGADYTLSDARYIRLKNIDLGYTFTKNVIPFISNMRVFVTAVNLITWSKEKDLDPDNRNDRGGYMPPSRTINVGVNVNF